MAYGMRAITSAFSKTRLPPELQRVLSCESPAAFLHFPLEEKGPFYQLRQVLAKGRHLYQILLKALYNFLTWIQNPETVDFDIIC